MAARTRKTQLTETWKERIKASVLGLRLYKHACGEIEMTPSQIKAAEVLLRKLVPDLSSVDMKAEVTTHEASLDELA